MTSSVRKASFTIGMGVSQGTLMSTKRTLMSLDALQGKTMDKTLENALKASINKIADL